MLTSKEINNMTYKELEAKIFINIESYIDKQMEFFKGSGLKREDFYYKIENHNGKLLISYDGGVIYDDLHDYYTGLFKDDRAVAIFGLNDFEWCRYDNCTIAVTI